MFSDTACLLLGVAFLAGLYYLFANYKAEAMRAELLPPMLSGASTTVGQRPPKLIVPALPMASLPTERASLFRMPEGPVAVAWPNVPAAAALATLGIRMDPAPYPGTPATVPVLEGPLAVTFRAGAYRITVPGNEEKEFAVVAPPSFDPSVDLLEITLARDAIGGAARVSVSLNGKNELSEALPNPLPAFAAIEPRARIACDRVRNVYLAWSP